MASYAEISPNEPDIIPDYVDDKTASSGTLPGARADGRVVPAKKDTVMTPEAGVVAAVTSKNEEPVIRSSRGMEQAMSTIPEIQSPSSVNAMTADKGIDGRKRPLAEPLKTLHREGECIPNVPDIQPDFIGEAEAVAITESSTLSAPVAEPPEPARSPWMRWYLVGTLLVVSVFGMLVFSQAVSALALARTLPVWAQYLLLIPLGVCCLAVLGVCGSLVHGWFKLRAVRQVDMSALEELRSRAKSRQDGIEHFQEARTTLEEYLRRYPLTHEGQTGLVRAGITPERIESLAKARHRLVDRSVDSRTWLEDFGVHFQADLDQAALSRVNSWAIKAAGCVIASPLPLLDSALVLGISMKMMKDLCTIYNVRSTRTGSLVLLNKAIVAAFIAGVAEDATEVAGGLAAEELSQMVGESTLNSLGARVAGVVAPKLGEGAINAFFIRRLGKATVRMLQPLRPKAKRAKA